MTWKGLAAHYPWPPMAGKPTPLDGWLHSPTRSTLTTLMGDSPKLVVEIGSWLGLSANHILKHHPQNRVVCIDTWFGSRDLQTRHELPNLYASFCANVQWARDRVIPLRSDSISGLGIVADHHLSPDIVYIDGGHDRAQVVGDVLQALTLFPKSKLCGDDWQREGVQQGLDDVALILSRGGSWYGGKDLAWNMAHNDTSWWLT